MTNDTVSLLNQTTSSVACSWQGLNVSEWASVAQALVAVLAIFAAILIASHQHRQQIRIELERDQRKAVTAARTIYVIFKRYAEELSSVHAMFSQAISTDELRVTIAKGSPENLFKTTEIAAAAIPLHELREAQSIELVASLLNNIRTTRLIFERAQDSWSETRRFPQDYSGVFSSHLNSARKYVGEAESHLKQLMKN